ncbi:MAG TPA: hypothetical protein VFP18_06865, partial [Candidatus Binatia bacterium]|nr:hypothetical protein [Candidatus Binatia bacterium]
RASSVDKEAVRLLDEDGRKGFLNSDLLEGNSYDFIGLFENGRMSRLRLRQQRQLRQTSTQRRDCRKNRYCRCRKSSKHEN